MCQGGDICGVLVRIFKDNYEVNDIKYIGVAIHLRDHVVLQSYNIW